MDLVLIMLGNGGIHHNAAELHRLDTDAQTLDVFGMDLHFNRIVACVIYDLVLLLFTLG